MKEENKLTPIQAEIINYEGKNMLVSASAGSGKTFVMIERVIRLITEGKADVDGILALTFTKLAAEEMKQKLVNALIGEIAKGNSVERMKNSLAQIPVAAISTFHSFCSDLLKRYFYFANVDPLYSIADESEAKELKKRAIDQLFMQKYADGDEDFLYLTRIYRKYRSDDALKNFVIDLLSFASSESDPVAYLSKLANSVNEKAYYEIAESLLDLYKKELRVLTEDFNTLKQDCDFWGIEKYSDFISLLSSRLESAVNCDGINTFLLVASEQFRNVPSFKTDDEEISELGSRLKDLNAKAKKLFASAVSDFDGFDKKGKEIYFKAERATKALCDLAIMFNAVYAEIKNDENKLDFSDLEQKTRLLLINYPDVCQELKQKYKYVFADEYQDVNGAQEDILSLICNDNAFMVGDVKQSIYSFRGCNPEIFSRKFTDFKNDDGGKAFSLDRNFRSSAKILEGVNKIFGRIMTENVADIDYASNPMTFGKLYPEDYGETILHVIDGEKEKKERSQGVYDVLKSLENAEENEDFYEGVLISQIIEEELTKKIYDVKLGKERNVEPQDIVILSRSGKSFTARIIKELLKRNIPAIGETGSSVCDYPEIQLLISVLKLIVFYADDPPLVALLKSSAGGLDEADLAKIRKPYPRRQGKTFKECADDYEIHGDDEIIKSKLKNFREYFEKIRLLAEFKGAGEILTEILTEKGLDLEISAMPLGSIRMRRVERFISESVQGGKNLSVADFLKRVEDAPETLSISLTANDFAVRAMSIHASKGLEFPIVIIAGIDRRFYFDDSTAEIAISRSKGIALKSYDENEMTYSSSIARAYLKKVENYSCVKEEMRILYVAMTRAQSRLHLVSDKPIGRTVTEFDFINAKSYADFISSRDFKTVVHQKEDLKASERTKVQSALIGQGRRSLTDKILSDLKFVYPHTAATALPVKEAVTKIVMESKTETNDLPFTPVLADDSIKPVSTTEGSIYHLFMENCDFFGDSVEKQIEKMVSNGVLSEIQAATLSREKLQNTLSSPLLADIKDYDIYREQPFIAPFKASEIKEGDCEDKILVQGVIDLLAVKGDEAIVIDYKTSSSGIKTLAARYKTQLDVYAAAVEKALGLKIKGKFILNLLTSEFIAL